MYVDLYRSKLVARADRSGKTMFSEIAKTPASKGADVRML
jgi:hypothetical protein